MPQTSPAARAILASGASRTQLDETGAREELAAYAFDQWAGSFALVPKPPRQFIRSVEAKYEYAAFLTSECEGRRVVWKEVAYRGTARVQPPPLRMSEVSPWSVDENALRLRSDHVATCDRCNGEGKRTCEQCRGSGHLTCRSCNGSGKVYGYTSNGARRLLNCKICHGHGFVTCPDCRRGIATCQICEGQKRVQRWMEVARWHRTEDVAYPLGIGDPPLSWPVNADNGVLERDATIIGDVAKLGALSADDLRGIDTQWLQKTSAKIANPPTSEEHIVRQRIRLAAIPRLRVAYAVGKHTGEIDFVGRRLLAMADQPQFFEKRAARLRATAVGCVAIFALTAMAYLGRGAFYRHAAGLSVVALFGATLVGIFMVVAEATATRR